MHDDRAAVGPRQTKRPFHRGDVVPVDRADVLQPEVLEHPLRRNDVLDALLDSVQRLVQRWPDHWSTSEDRATPLEEALVAASRAQGREVMGKAADGRRVGPRVVVDDDDQRTVLRRCDVVERLPGHPAGERPVTDHGDDGPAFQLTSDLVALGDAVGPGQRGRGVAVLDDVVLGLTTAGVAGQSAARAQALEARGAAGEDLVDVRLVAGVPDDPVTWRVEDPVQRQRQLDRPEVRAEMSTGAGDLLDEEGPDLAGQRVTLLEGESAYVARRGDTFKQTHPGSLGPPMRPCAAQTGCRWGRRAPRRTRARPPPAGSSRRPARAR